MPQDTAANAGLLHELAAAGGGDYDDNSNRGSNSENASIINNILFGKYELGRLLGHGAFAKVYHARHTETGESVAIKAVSKRRVIKSGHVEHIKREIAIMRRVRHPNVIRLHEVLATKTKIFFVMDFAKGGELFSRVARGGRFGESLCRRYFRQLISAVGHCHKLGVFHRDIKPENLLLDADWNLKVSDFGLSAVVLGGSSQEKVLHTLCGTPAYVSPEMLARKGYGGAAADVWSCGVVLFVLAAGYLPFNDCNLMNMYRKIYRGEYRCPRWFSPGLKRLISRLLDTNPETRITIDEIHEDAWFRESDSVDGGCSSGSDQDEIQSVLSSEEVFDYRSSGEWEELVAGLKPEGRRCVNAFDIISTSSGFDLSGLFRNTCDVSVAPEAAEVEEMFVSGESVEKIIERIEEVGMEAVEVAEVEAKRKEWWVRMEGAEGTFVINVGVHRLTEELVAIEVRRREKAGCSIGPDFWRCKLRPQICGLSLSSTK